MLRRPTCAPLSLLVALVSATLGGPGARAQPTPDATARAAALDSVGARLVRGYVSVEVAQATVAHLERQRPALLAFADPSVFADSLTAILRFVSRDRHLHVVHDPRAFAALARPEPESPSAGDADTLGQARAAETERAAALQERRARNYGFRRAELLDGNVGLVELTRMEEPDAEAASRAVAAMALVSGADAVVVDLRQNPGGTGRMNQLLSTFFFAEGDDRHLVSNENRSAGTLRQEWTLPYVPGRRLPDVPLYLLVSAQTGSAAEGFAYNLQALGRAVIVGAPTAGAAHSGRTVPLAGGFVLFLPTGRTVNPVTGANWEGAGVQPDWRAAPGLELAQALALVWEGRLRAAAPHSPEADAAAWALAYHHARLAPVAVAPALLAAYAGSYEGAREVAFDGGELRYRHEGRPSFRLLPLSDSLFVVEGADRYGPGNTRVLFRRDAAGRVNAMRTLIRHAPTQVATFDDRRLDGPR